MANKSKSQGKSKLRTLRPRQTQRRLPGRQAPMRPQPESIPERYHGSNKLAGRVALITGGDSGIGRAVAALFAREGADVAIAYLEETPDALETQQLVQNEGRKCLLIRGDLGRKTACAKAVSRVIAEYGKLDILVNNAAEQHEDAGFEDLDEATLIATFRTNIFAIFFLTQASLPYLKKSEHAAIINTTSVTAYRGSPGLLAYSSTKGAIVSFTRSLSQGLAEENIRVNAVAPGPIWTPLIPASFDAEKVAKFGSDTPMGRAGEPWECATCFVFLASDDSSYMTGQVLHPNGGEIING